MNAALGLVSKPEGNSRHLNSAPDATIIFVRAQERGRGFLSYLPSFLLFYFGFFYILFFCNNFVS